MSVHLDLIAKRQKLVEQIERLDAQIGAIGNDYRIALRPDDHGADPFDHRTRLDDIVVRDVAMFRAEQMDVASWWVCCYLDNTTQDRICWSVNASARPRRIDWTGYEYPSGPVVYEHDLTEATS